MNTKLAHYIQFIRFLMDCSSSHFFIRSTFFVEFHFPVGASKDEKGQISVTTEVTRIASSKITDDGKRIISPHVFSFVGPFAS